MSTGPSASQRATGSFRLLRGPSAHLPPVVRTHLSHILANQLDGPLNPTTVRRAQTAEGVVWVFLAERSLCLAQDGHGAVGCSTLSNAESHGIQLGVFSPPSDRISRPHEFLLIGLAPDGIGRVSATIGDRLRTIRVQNNLFSIASDQPIFVRSLGEARRPQASASADP